MALRSVLSFLPSVGVLLLISAYAGLAPEAAAESFYFNPSHLEVDGCTQPTRDIEVWIGYVAEIQGFSVELTYPEDLNLLEVLEGSIFGGSGAFQSLLTPGSPRHTLAVDNACLACWVDGPGHLFTLRFSEPWPCGFSDSLAFSRGLWADRYNVLTNLPGITGTITVSCPTSSGGTTWSSIKGLYR